MWKYKTFGILIERNSVYSLDDKLDELGADGWEAYNIDSEDNYDLRVGTNRLYTGTTYTVYMKRPIKQKSE